MLFSSHQLDLVERLCDDVVIIAEGRVRAFGEREQLRRNHSGLRYRLTVEPDAGWLRDLDELTVLDIDGPRALVELHDPGQDQWLLAAAQQRGTVRAFAPDQPSLSEIFREVVR